jgi:hypothetical protein
MWTIYILVGLVLFLGILATIFNAENFADTFEGIMATIVVGAIAGVVGLVIALCIPSKTFMAEYEYKIMVLQDNSSIQGSFFLGTGSVNGTMKYFMYVDYGDHVKMESLSTSRTKIKYSDKAYLEIKQKTQVPNALINKFSILFDDSEEFTIYVPEGTIKQNYILDAQ